MIYFRTVVDEPLYSAVTVVQTLRHSGGGVVKESRFATPVGSTTNYTGYDRLYIIVYISFH